MTRLNNPPPPPPRPRGDRVSVTTGVRTFTPDGADKPQNPDGTGRSPAEASTTAPAVDGPAFDADRLFPPGMGATRDFFLDVARSTQTPPEMVALAGLAVTSACLCNVSTIHGHGDHYEPAPIWALVAAPSGSRKSSVMKHLCRPIIKWERDEAEAAREKIAAAEQERALLEARQKHVQQQLAKQPRSAETAELHKEARQLTRDLARHVVARPPRLLASEPTPEALSIQMAQNGGRALVASAEGDALDIMEGLYSGKKNYGTLLKAHAGDPIRVGRVLRDGESIDRPAASVALLVQPEAIAELWSDQQAKGRGLLARFNLLLPENRLGSRRVRATPIDESLTKAWSAILLRLLAKEPKSSCDDELCSVELSDPADELFLQFEELNERRLGGDHFGEDKDWGSKLPGLVLRIALTLIMLRIASAEQAAELVLEVDAATMRSAIEWAEFLCAARSLAIEGLWQDEQQKLVDFIVARGGRITVQKLRDSSRAWKPPGKAKRALEDLVRIGLARKETTNRGRTVVYVVDDGL